MIARLLLAALALYRRWISPAIHSVFPGGCRYQPTCSEYAVEAIQAYGAPAGAWLALKRLLRCHPLARGGFDPIPLAATRPSPRIDRPDPLP